MTVRSHAYIRFVPMHSIASLLVLRSFVRRAVSWTSTLSSGKRAPLRRSVRLHGVLHTALDIQVRHLSALCHQLPLRLACAKEVTSM